ncbi:N-acylneuraminate cytidylyltransferase [Butyrivibrio sp. DSM 10294]|uniref:N-acylneuraminate cytidylyltransferase n=1 Tax=Butyrivibrio sp. DSM 10294 TaxID=2972457 RepID=UPI00234E4FB5|nr:N-acylneuraminate cytidylyltransferase [Butyrivibrio sp. DSM 10294]MDC7293599.1 N-acylneuraminate cytidylyltransferase [Butyrivibrio sp. DSM 10294]
METVAFIPVRGGSKSIPLKNIKEICGKPLVYWTVAAACKAECIDRVYVATDSAEIKSVVEQFSQKEIENGSAYFSKAEVIDRNPENASDTASTESVMLEFAEKYDFKNIVLIQATSPMLESSDIDGGFELYKMPDTDSVLSVVRQKRFLWDTDKSGYAVASNYDYKHRPRRQEFDGYLMENGAFYITAKENLTTSKNRLFGRIRAYEMSEDSALEIDEPNDFIIIEALLRKREKSICNSGERPEIKMIVTDCDGCLTDGGMYYSENGDELKKFNTKDGMALVRAHEKGIITGIITGEYRELNRRRAEKLRMDFIESGIKDKMAALKAVCDRFGIDLRNVLYIGDDINDIEPMKAAGVSACPKDAAKQVAIAADYISEVKGGYGAVRDIIEILIGI